MPKLRPQALLLGLDPADQVDIFRLLALFLLVLTTCSCGSDGASAGAVQHAFAAVDLDDGLVGVKAAIDLLGTVDGLTTEEMAVISAGASENSAKSEVVAYLAIGVMERISFWGDELVCFEAGFEEVGGENDRGMGDGADELLGAQNLWGGEMRAGEVVGDDEDAEFTKTHLGRIS